MRFSAFLATFLGFVAALESARAQTGTLDQVSGGNNAGFNGDAVSLVWQAQVSAGLPGQLEGFRIELTGAQGASLQVSVRIGAGWNTSPAVFQTTVVKPTGGNDMVFVDTTSANIALSAGTLFVIEMQGTGTGTGIVGSYVAPSAGPPLYPEPLFLGGPGCFADCGWRLGFSTFVLTALGSTFCAGDGSAAACPCGNVGNPGRGCGSSMNPTGARLAGSGNFSIAHDTGTITGTGMPNSPCLYFQGTASINGGSGAGFGDGLRCVGGVFTSVGIKTNQAGTSQYPIAGDAPISVRCMITTPGMRSYQVWYRNAASFCTPSTFNLSNGLMIDWQP